MSCSHFAQIATGKDRPDLRHDLRCELDLLEGCPLSVRTDVIVPDREICTVADAQMEDQHDARTGHRRVALLGGAGKNYKGVGEAQRGGIETPLMQVALYMA